MTEFVPGAVPGREPEEVLEEVRAAIARQAWSETGHLSLRGVASGAFPAELPPDILVVLRTVRGIDLSGNRLTEPPSWLGLLPSLEELDLSGNRISVLTGLAGLPSGLRALDLSENRLAGLAGEWAVCTRLRWLSLAGNRLASLGDLSALPGIEVLNLARNRLRSLEGLPGVATLRSLDASANQLDVLVPALAEFVALRRLDLSHNRLTGASLDVLAGLGVTELFLDSNRIERVPEGLERRSFRTWSLAGNPVTSPAGEDISDPHTPATDTAATDTPASRSLGTDIPGTAARDFAQRFMSGGYEPGVDYFEAPEYQFGFRINVRSHQAAQRLIDLYYKGYPSLPADLRFGGGQTVPLDAVTRRAALDLIARQPTGSADVRVRPTNRLREVDAAVGFAEETVNRLPGAELVADSTGERLTREDVPAAPRVVNVALADETADPLPVTAILAFATPYLVRVSMGPEIDETVVLNPVPLPLGELPPSSRGGWWFDVVVSSAHVDVAAEEHRMFVPLQGPGWVCPCTGDEHTCQPAQRRAYLDIPFRTRPGDGRGPGGERGPGGRTEAALRCTVYHRNNAVQSIRVAFAIGDAAGVQGGTLAVGPAVLIHGIVDYALADDLARAGELPPRRLSVLTNESSGGTGGGAVGVGGASGGTHTIVVRGAAGSPVAVNLTEAGVAETLRAIRAQLTIITLGSDGRTDQYADAKGDDQAAVRRLTADLETLAYLGSRFWEDVVPFGADQRELRGQLTTTATIQIARVTDTVFPWAIVYDYPHLLDDPWEPCDLLRQWPQAQSALAGYPKACPFAAGHQLNTLCPFGFWGFRHLIEQPPSVLRGLLRTVLPVPAGAHAAAVRSLNLDEALSMSHLNLLRQFLAPRFQVTDCDSRDDFLAAIDTPALPLIYFYCHGKTAKLGDRGVDLLTPYLEIGQGEKLGTGDLNALAAAGKWHQERWREVPPLVFINGCHTAALSPEQLVTFVNAFAGAEAAGVIGTETAVAQPVASDFAQRFYQHLMASPAMTVGQALRQARLDLLANGNVAGLVYTAFCSMDLALGP